MEYSGHVGGKPLMFDSVKYYKNCFVKLMSSFGRSRCFSDFVCFFVIKNFAFGFSLVAAPVFVVASSFQRFERSIDLSGDFFSGTSSTVFDEPSVSISTGD